MIKTRMPVNPKKAKKIKTPDGVFTVAELAYRLGCSKTKVSDYLKKYGNDWYFKLIESIESKKRIEYRGETYTFNELSDKLRIRRESLCQLINHSRRFNVYDTDENAIDAFINRRENGSSHSKKAINSGLNYNRYIDNVTSELEYARCAARSNS